MLMTRRKPATIAEILTEELTAPMGLAQAAKAMASAVERPPGRHGQSCAAFTDDRARPLRAAA